MPGFRLQASGFALDSFLSGIVWYGLGTKKDAHFLKPDACSRGFWKVALPKTV
jgi:hypothetical protein